MKTYLVRIPIAGHFVVEVEADNEKDAIEKAWISDTKEGDVEWELLDSFNSGNVCYCPPPWESEAKEV